MASKNIPGMSAWITQNSRRKNGAHGKIFEDACIDIGVQASVNGEC